jgi:hypothetical protein
VSDPERGEEVTERTNCPTSPNPFEGSERSSLGMRILLSPCGVDEEGWVIDGDPDVAGGISVVNSFFGEFRSGGGSQVRGDDEDLCRIQVLVLLNQRRDLVRIKFLSGDDLQIHTWTLWGDQEETAYTISLRVRLRGPGIWQALSQEGGDLSKKVRFG